MVTLAQLKQFAPKAKGDDIDYLNAAMVEFGIDTPIRQAMFMGQLCVECIEFTTFEEIWGPTKDQERYEGSVSLGNTEPGDGYKYRGFGAIQNTGRKNVTAATADLGVDFVSHPELAATPEQRYRVSGWYWRKHNLNACADIGDSRTCTRLINGPGMYREQERDAYFLGAAAAIGAQLAC